MLPNERTTRSEVVSVAEELEALVVASGRNPARPLVNFLRSQRLNVQLLTEGEIAFEEALIHPPDVILVDDAVGPAGGIELCQRLKNNSRTHFVPVIVWTPQDDRQFRLRAYSVGADAVFAPNMDAQERRTRLWALLRSHSQYRRQEQRRRAQSAEMAARRRWVTALVVELHKKLSDALAAAGSAGNGAGGQGVTAILRDLLEGTAAIAQLDQAQTGRLPFEEGQVDAAGLLIEAVQRGQDRATRADKILQLDLRSLDRLPPGLMVRGDRALLLVVMDCLITQSLVQPGNRRVTVDIQMSGAQPYRAQVPLQTDTNLSDAHLRLSVRGDGVAIPPPAGDPSQVFEPFARRLPGAPLGQAVGLALAAALVELHGGKMSADGNEFGFDLRVGAFPPMGR